MVDFHYTQNPGVIHRLANEECQDVVSGRKYANGGAIALADGAGSKRYARESAILAVNTLLDIGERISESTDVHEIRKLVLNRIRQAFMRTSWDFSQCGCTLLFVVAIGDKTIIGHIGDGVILRYEGDRFRVISEPENGYTQNATYFVPTENDLDGHMRIIVLQDIHEDEHYILASDGLAGYLYNAESLEGVNACNILLEWSGNSNNVTWEEQVAKSMDDVFDKLNTDDKSIAIINIAR